MNSENQKWEGNERVSWTRCGRQDVNRSLLFVFEVVDHSDTVSVILVDFLSLTMLCGDNPPRDDKDLTISFQKFLFSC